MLDYIYLLEATRTTTKMGNIKNLVFCEIRENHGIWNFREVCFVSWNALRVA